MMYWLSWILVPIGIGGLLILASPASISIGELALHTTELSLVLGGILFSSIDRRTSFFVRGLLHLTVMLYTFVTFLPFRAFFPFIADAGIAFTLSAALWLTLMITQLFILCPRCKALYSMIYHEPSKPFSSWYAPWITHNCAKCGRKKSLPNHLERD